MNGERRVVKDPLSRRSEILETAAQMSESYWYDELSMQEISDELSITKGTLQHYFSSKEQLLIVCSSSTSESSLCSSQNSPWRVLSSC